MAVLSTSGQLTPSTFIFPPSIVIELIGKSHDLTTTEPFYAVFEEGLVYFHLVAYT